MRCRLYFVVFLQKIIKFISKNVRAKLIHWNELQALSWRKKTLDSKDKSKVYLPRQYSLVTIPLTVSMTSRKENWSSKKKTFTVHRYISYLYTMDIPVQYAFHWYMCTKVRVNDFSLVIFTVIHGDNRLISFYNFLPVLVCRAATSQHGPGAHWPFQAPCIIH